MSSGADSVPRPANTLHRIAGLVLRMGTRLAAAQDIPKLAPGQSLYMPIGPPLVEARTDIRKASALPFASAARQTQTR